MALVKVLVANLFAGASFQKLEVGVVYDVGDAVAEKWIAAGKAEETKEKGQKLQFEVATPSAPVAAETSALQGRLDDALAQVKQLQEAAIEKDSAHTEALAAETKRADEAVAALAEATRKAK
ncbi:hypothetical protein N7922_13895 [Kosakonia sp. ML.JS2a]|uniref:hypothetical protein n=1 Tax=Kosakonia sp. ML.JS2a TaxID=2980557 RepID=UPI0021D8F717|nr:hypothetical protein [Kosakonia sp. ML.JS2a]UXY08984.1 hypothetical protein N7922_13895 [Kosakonia sp. ML.JS2a]